MKSIVKWRQAAGTQFSPWVILVAAILFGGRQSLFAQPANDNFTNRTFLTGYDNVLTLSNVGATAEPDEPNPNFTWIRPSLWYSWTAPEAGTAVVAYSGDNYLRYLAVFTGEKLKSLRQIGRTDVAVGFEAKAGQTFQIQAMAPVSTPDYQMHLEFFPRPVNDAFTNRTRLEGILVSTNGDTLAATREPGEPRHNQLSYGRSVWFSWVAPSSGWVFLDLTNAPHMVCEPYTGKSIRKLRPIDGVLLNQDPFGGIMAVNAGSEYIFAVDGEWYYDKFVYSGQFTLNLEFTGLTLFSPVHNSTFIAPEQISLLATNTLPNVDGEIGQLEYYALNLINQQENFIGTGSGSYYGVAWNAPINGYYRIQARGTNTDGRILRSNPAIIVVRPGNDDFSGRFPVSGLDVTWPVNFDAATRVSNDPKVARILGDDFEGTTLWWTWTAPRSGTVALSCDNWAIALTVYTGKPGSFSPVLQPCWTSGQFQAQAGKTYQILLSDRYPAYAPSQGNLRLIYQN